MEFFVRNRPYTGSVQAVVLDWAGTAVDFGCMGPVMPFVEAFARRGVTVTVEEARRPMGLMKRDHIQAMLASPDVAAKWRKAFGREPTDGDVQELYLELEGLVIATLSRHSAPVPGLMEALDGFRKRGVKIGSTTGYTRPMMEVLVPAAMEKGYRPDSIVCSSDVPRGRPFPFMCFQNAMNLEIYPMESMVKIGDTVADIHEGLNAGMWTVGITLTGNELGLTEAEAAELETGELDRRLAAIGDKFIAEGAHYVAEDIGRCVAVIDAINARLAKGERP